jgi:tRNA1Val (adenine37-N6)-methyltransferase
MPNTSFAFKQFIIKQDKCAMKVGTDAVLLGAWVLPNGSKHILDIGAGTGVIALMLAQKTAAHIDAIDIDEEAVLQAKQNVLDSKFASQITVTRTSLQHYSKASTQKYNLIVTILLILNSRSNPQMNSALMPATPMFCRLKIYWMVC